MAREIGISSPHRRVAESRWRNTQWFELRSVYEGLVPVQVLGHRDFSDVERPSWSISCQSAHNGGYSACAITSASDIAIEAIGYNTFSLGGVPADVPVIIFTPPLAFVPFELLPAIWTAGIRPRVEFDTGRTVVITGGNLNLSPIVGWYLFSRRNVNAASVEQIYYFDPPLILPKTMFLALQAQIWNRALISSFRYREIG